MKVYPFLNGSLFETDVDTARIIEFEKRRQERKIILIASESICPRPVLEAQASVFSNIYAEGYPSLRMAGMNEENLLDFEKFMATQRRLSDRRHYKGCDYANFIESLAQWRAALLFAHDDGNVRIKPEDIFVNVQPLSGAAANNAIYLAFVPPGETVMGLALPHGGHLTHGSPFNRSGKIYRGISYEIDQKTGRINYEQMRELAQKHHPKMIIGGASAYPWDIDWKKMREIADECGAMLLADIAHPSGLVAGGQFPNPLGYAHVTNMTTHKTLCGPRAAIILTTDPQIAKRVDNAVFPGEQGGPHINTIAALAVAFKLAATPDFRELMKNVIDNANALAKALNKRGLKLGYGGTNTHLCLLNLKHIKTISGYPLKGDTAAHVLDLCGITCNKNTIAGDMTAADSSAIRLGTTWVTQLGMGPSKMDKIADLIYRVLTNIRTYTFHTAAGERYRGKIPHELMLQVRKEVSDLLKKDEHPDYPQFPHYHAPFTAVPRENVFARLASKTQERNGISLLSAVENEENEKKQAKESCVLIHHSEGGLLEIFGEKAQLFMADLIPADIYALDVGKGLRTFLFDREGCLIDDVYLFRLTSSLGFRYLMLTGPGKRELVKEWLNDLSDGYTLIENRHGNSKLIGPVTVLDMFEQTPAISRLLLVGPKAPEIISKLDESLKDLDYLCLRDIEHRSVTMRIARSGYDKSQCVYEIHLPLEQLSQAVSCLQAAGGNEIKESGQCVLDDLRKQAKLPDEDSKTSCAALLESFPGYFSYAKPHFVGETPLLSLHKKDKEIYLYPKYEGEPRFTQLAGEHKKLTKRPLAPFAGWMMPILYTSILEEHQAVRETAGLFDVTHMGVIELKGADAERYLDLVTTNEVSKLEIGQSQYSYIITPDGSVLDDIMIYRREKDYFMLVVNAVNAERDFGWMQAIASRKYVIDPDFSDREIDVCPQIRDLHVREAGVEAKVDIALQGPRSLDILLSVVGNDEALRARLTSLGKSCFIEEKLAGIELIISRSGYTGEEWGYELYLHPDNAVLLWKTLLEKGKPFGIKPTGLGARDSTRTEAGFPLHGHELEGPYDISPVEAGYGAFVKYYKPFFIGKNALLAKDAASRRKVIRFEIREAGTRAVRHGALVFNKRGQVIGNVTSCTFVGNEQIGLAYIDKRYCAEGTKLGILNVPHGKKTPPPKALSDLKAGDKFPMCITANIISRFIRKALAKN